MNLQESKDHVAKIRGYEDWNHYLSFHGSGRPDTILYQNVSDALDEAAELYAKSKVSLLDISIFTKLNDAMKVLKKLLEVANLDDGAKVSEQLLSEISDVITNPFVDWATMGMSDIDSQIEVMKSINNDFKTPLLIAVVNSLKELKTIKATPKDKLLREAANAMLKCLNEIMAYTGGVSGFSDATHNRIKSAIKKAKEVL